MYIYIYIYGSSPVAQGPPPPRPRSAVTTIASGGFTLLKGTIDALWAIELPIFKVLMGILDLFYNLFVAVFGVIAALIGNIGQSVLYSLCGGKAVLNAQSWSIQWPDPKVALAKADESTRTVNY